MRFVPLAFLASLGLIGLSLMLPAAEQPGESSQRGKAEAAFKAGNFKDAYEAYRKLTLDPSADRLKVSEDLNAGILCLAQLGRGDEIDEFREAAIAAHKDNWRLLQKAASTYIDSDHQGFIVAGKFYRGGRRGGDGKYVNALQRDRVRALQLMEQGLPLALKDDDRPAVSAFHLEFARILLGGNGNSDAWRLQVLTDISQLPDYEEGYFWRGGQSRGAPVDAGGKPVLHLVPSSYEAAQTDGERWRWMLSQAIEVHPSRRNEVELIFADFLHGQFGVQTMAVGSWFRGASDDDDTKKDESGTYALHTLTDDETIARLATGI